VPQQDGNLSGGVVRARREWHPHLGPWTGLAFALPTIVLIGLFVIFPLIQLLVDASAEGAGLDNYIAVFTENISRRALFTTVLDSAIVAVITVAIGSVLAWTLHVTERRWLRVLVWITVLVPFTMGTIIKNYAILLLLVANGPVNGLLMGLGITDAPISLLYTPFAVIYGISYSLIPYAVLTLYSVFAPVDRNLLASASVLGASRMTALRTVIFPLVRGGIGVTLALVFVLSLGFYITPLLLGGLQSPFVATVINQQIFLLYDFPGAAANAVVVLVIAVIVMGIALVTAGAKTVRKVLG